MLPPFPPVAPAASMDHPQVHVFLPDGLPMGYPRAHDVRPVWRPTVIIGDSMEILFVHGAGGWREDQPMAGELRARLEVPVSAPPFPDDDMSAAAWRGELDRQREALGPDLVIVGHSFGASMALLHLADNPSTPPPLGLALLAMPFWGAAGWQAEYALPADAEPPAGLPVWLHHCRDDDVVPFEHLERHASRLPRALIRRHPTGGHQFEGRMAAVADDLAPLAR